ncbi:hypothetical protein [Lentzea sp. NPDC059081]
MRLTVLCSCGACPEPGRACSGFAVEAARSAFGGEVAAASEGDVHAVG